MFLKEGSRSIKLADLVNAKSHWLDTKDKCLQEFPIGNWTLIQFTPCYPFLCVLFSAHARGTSWFVVL